MDSLPDAVFQFILSSMRNAKDVASCNCVSKHWKEAMPFVRSLYFPRNAVDETRGEADDNIGRMIFSTIWLEELVIYCPFSCTGLNSWLSGKSRSLRHLELRMDDLMEKRMPNDSPTKMDCIGCVIGLETLKLWAVCLVRTPNWGLFQRLHTLEIVGARLRDSALSDTLQTCPNLTNLALLGCEGVSSISIELLRLEHCRLDFYGNGDCCLYLTCPKLQLLEVQGCAFIRLNKDHCLKHLSISNNAGKVQNADFGKLSGVEFLCIRGIQWDWDAICSILSSANMVEHLFMKIEFTGAFERLEPFPEIDLVDFFNSHPKLCKFEIHGAMFAALCQMSSLRSVEPKFCIPYLEEVVITVRSPLNAEQKLSTLESLVKHSLRLKRMVIRISQMKNTHQSADEFFEEICRFKHMNHVVEIE